MRKENNYNYVTTTGDTYLTCDCCGNKVNILTNGLCKCCFRVLQQNRCCDNKQPYVCPICKGTGKVPSGYYCRLLSDTFVSSGGEEECRSCKGTGVLWG